MGDVYQPFPVGGRDELNPSVKGVAMKAILLILLVALSMK